MSTQALVIATEKSLERIKEKLAEAKDVASTAQLAWTESEAAVMELQGEADAVEAALRALRGETPAVQPDSVPDSVATPSESPAPEEETGEEFEARMKRQARQQKKEKYAEGTYAGIKCSGCGTVGSLYDSVQTFKGGRMTPIIACHECGSTKRR
jgi:ribosomal protein S27E